MFQSAQLRTILVVIVFRDVPMPADLQNTVCFGREQAEHQQQQQRRWRWRTASMDISAVRGDVSLQVQDQAVVTSEF